MDVNEIKALISPNRPGGVSALELEKASRLIDELDDLARQTVTGCVDIARRERARAEAAEAEVRELTTVLDAILASGLAQQQRAEAAEAEIQAKNERLRAALATETEAADMYHDELKRARVALLELDAEVEQLREIARKAVSYRSGWNYDAGTEDEREVYFTALNEIAGGAAGKE